MAVDWAEWERSLGRFSRATTLCVSAYDELGVRRVGPLHDSILATVLGSSGIWSAGDASQSARQSAPPEASAGVGAGYRIEAELVRRVIDTGTAASCNVAGEMTVLCAPLIIGGAVRGALVYGWVLPNFGTPLGCQRLATELRVDPMRLWSAVRLTPPVPPVRLVVLTELLQTLMEAAARHEEALESLNAMSRLREIFLASVSHELRTPLSALGLRIEILLRADNLPEPVVSSLEKMKQHVEQQARMVDDLIDASRTRTGQLQLQLRATSLHEVLEASLAAISPHADAKGVTLTTQGLQDPVTRTVLADPHRLQQVFWNLLSNAVKFTPDGGSVCLTVLTDHLAHEVVIADTGRGIEADLLSSVFDPFRKTQAANAAGLGLGLSIARHIVEAHAGTIVAQSDGAEAGARFVVRLPLAEAESPF